MTRNRILQAYYLATPLFAVLDFGGGAPVRVAALHDPLQRAAYYAAIFALGLVCRWRPPATPWVGMGESALNILLLVLAVMLPIWSLPEAYLAGAPLEGPFDRVSMINFALSAGVFTAAFHRNRGAVLAGRE